MQISLDRLFAKYLQFFFAKLVQFLMSKAFQKAKFYQNLTRGSGSKQRFSLLKEKTVIQLILKIQRRQNTFWKAKTYAFHFDTL